MTRRTNSQPLGRHRYRRGVLFSGSYTTFNPGDQNNGMAGDLVNPLVGFETAKERIKNCLVHFVGHGANTWYAPQAIAEPHGPVKTSQAGKIGWDWTWQIDGIRLW